MQLYDWQREAIDALVEGNGRVLVVAPTGGGKSMCFQQPAVDLPGVAVVITPLVALMADQVASLTARGIPATYLAANLDADENRRRIDMVLAGEVKLLYIAPERLASEAFVEGVLAKLPLSLLAIDEAHCISHWGHDFRPDYLHIGELVERLRPPRLIACTATATPAVRREIVERLHMPGAHQVLRGFARHNLRLAVEEVSGPKAKEKRIGEEVKRALVKPNAGMPTARRGTALVYTGSRRNAEDVAEAMRALGWRADHYHAGMSGPERTAVQEKFQAGALDVIAATNAFGMGIDRPDIRLVIHQSLPESVEAYYQEVGRAGRDGEPAAGLLLIADPDIAWRFKMIASDEFVSAEQQLRRREMLRAMVGYAETSACRHDSILEYFEDEAEELGGCSQCDNCVAAAEGRLSPEPDEAESAGVVREALAAIRSLPFAEGAGAVASYLIGHGSAQIRRYDWQARPQFGVLKDRREDWVRRLLRRFVASGVLAIDPEHQTLHVTRRTVDVINGAKPNPVRLPSQDRPTLRVGARDPRSAAGTLDGDAATLFERLKAWRRLRADADGVPAYVICHDATLAQIAEARPASGDELMSVNGMGPAKLQRYGVQILAEVRDHTAEFGERVPPHLAAGQPDPNGDTEVGDGSLYDQLRAWRRRRSTREGVKLWEVCSNDVLLAVINALPRTADALRAIDEITPQQADRYGAEIVAAVNAYLDDAAAPEAAGDTKSDHERRIAELRTKHPRAYEPWTDEEDARLVQLVAAGTDVKDIATALERQRTAIASRIEKLRLTSV